jgi:DNA adenine methylase
MIVVPPIKCQGIKTKLVPAIRNSVPPAMSGRWIEPFCGSGVVALNIQPERAILADKNPHIILFYKSVQDGSISPGSVRQYLQQAGEQLRQYGQAYYNEVRARFNKQGDPLDFLFLNRACFNGVIRFNRDGAFNVPFGHKPDRFRPAYVTKIVNQVRKFQTVATHLDWRFEVADFRQAIAWAKEGDFIYADPPYFGRHTDYYASWSETDEKDLVSALQATPARFLLSTWHHNQHRTNLGLTRSWQSEAFTVRLVEHFYHVGSSEARRGEMTEALISNYPLPDQPITRLSAQQLALFEE